MGESAMSAHTVRRLTGMTLVEVLVALVLLAGVLLALGRFSGTLARTTGTARLVATATQLVADRLETVKGAPRYIAIESLYVANETNLTGFKGFTRQTQVLRVGGAASDSIDYKIVTVTVSNPSLTKSVRKSTVIAPF
jgi:Tfp pilus assembly protein PilV